MKNLEALIRGYVFFKVNNNYYLWYNSALKERKSVPDSKPVVFLGFHVFKGWLGFYLRAVHGWKNE